MPRLIGAGKAAELIMSARILKAQEALEVGLVNAVLPDENFVDHAIEWAGRIAARPKRAVFAAKRAIFDGLRMSLEDGLRLEGQLFAELNASEESKEMKQQAIERGLRS